MRRTDRNRAALLTMFIVIVAACGSATASGDPPPLGTPPATGSPAATGSVAEAEIPAPDFAWAFDGDGKASAGGMDVEFVGAYESSADSVAFDGYTGHGIAAEGLVHTTESFTLSAWANYAKLNGFSAVLGVLGDDSYAAALGIGYDSEWFFATKTADTTGFDNAVAVQTDPVVAGNRWTHVAGVYDSDAGLIRLYVDGKRVGEAATEGLFSAKGPLTIGRGQFDGGPGNFWPGAIDSVAIYQSVLTDDQVAKLSASTRPTSPPPPMPAPDPSTYANGILNGTWDVVLDEEGAKLIIENYANYVDAADEVVVRIGFDNHEWWEGKVLDGELILEGGVPEGSGGTFVIDGAELILTDRAGYSVYAWALDGDQLTIKLIEGCGTEGVEQVCSDRTEIEAEDPFVTLIMDNTFTKSSDDPNY
jgi:hypothetical protein